MLDIGLPEMLVILLVVLLIFGPGKLPEAGAALGRAMREFREAVQGPAPAQSAQETTPDDHPKP